jgi:hypothetical protein
MLDDSRELWWSFFAILAITIIYLLVTILLSGVPAASSLFGHSIGILGFLLMLSTETLYTLRKRSRSAHWGRMSTWLRLHIFTGLVGPYMVLLHTSWKFNGLAGVVTLLTGVIVVSGFIGRYIYTAVPRRVDGLEMETDEINSQLKAIEDELSAALQGQTSAGQPLTLDFASVTGGAAGGALGLGGFFQSWRLRREWNAEKKRLAGLPPEQVKSLEKLIKHRQALTRQATSLHRARSLMALWHTIHIPIGLALFAAAFVHVFAAIYYATLLK